jgi:hypothetical protein
MLHVKSRLLAAATHLGLSVAIAALVASLVFVLWYPAPFREISGGRELFFIVIAVDVVLGPLITFAIFDTRKPRAELVRDLSVVVLLQLGGLAYGLHTVYVVRPQVLALERDRLRVVRVFDLAQADLAKAPPKFRRLPVWGMAVVATRAARPDEKQDTLAKGLAGEDIGMRPNFWLPAEQTRSAFAQAAMPLDRLLRMRPARKADLERAVAATGRPADQLGYLPILARRTDWSALVDRNSGEIVGYVDIEGF